MMATNAVPLVLPCHRVVPSGGGTGRYAWGDAVKPVLLDVEECSERVAGPALRPLPSPRARSEEGALAVPGGIA